MKSKFSKKAVRFAARKLAVIANRNKKRNAKHAAMIAKSKISATEFALYYRGEIKGRQELKAQMEAVK